MVELVNLPEEEKFFEAALSGHVDYLSIDQQGTHIIQKIISCLSEDYRQFVFDEVVDGFKTVSKTSHGLCVIKRLIANTQKLENRQKLIDYISEKAIELAQDPYGNYVIQEVMQKWGEYDYSPLYDKIKTKVAQLSIQKFSSNVVEKCLQMCSDEQRDDVITHIAQIDKLSNVMKNSFGNYVVQKALTFCDGSVKEKLIESIERSIPDIQDKKIRNKWEQIMGLHISSCSPERNLNFEASNQGMVPLDASWGQPTDAMYGHSDPVSPGLPLNQSYGEPQTIQLHEMGAPLNQVVDPFNNFEQSKDFGEDNSGNGAFNQFYGMDPFGNPE